MSLPWQSTAIPDLAVVVVTGASSGIGEAVAAQLAAEGRHLVLVSRSEDKLADVARACDRRGAASTLVHAADVSDDDAVAGLFDSVRERHGRLDAVVHCAGEVSYGRLEDTSAEAFDQVMATNVNGTANVSRHALTRMREQHFGVLVIVGSLLGHLAIPEMTPYVVSKWAVRALARQMSLENMDESDVHVVHLAPGSVDTPIYDKAIEDGGAEHQPPPPTISPERVARSVSSVLKHPVRERQTAWLNHALIAAFRTAPWVWDRAVGPAFRLASKRD